MVPYPPRPELNKNGSNDSQPRVVDSILGEAVGYPESMWKKGIWQAEEEGSVCISWLFMCKWNF